MKSIRELINLMESVEAVPAVGGLEEKSSSEKQARFMAAAAHDPEFAKRVGVDQSVAKEFNKADTGTELLSKAAKNREESCSMSEDRENDLNFIAQSIRANYDIASSEDELKQMVAGETGYGQNPDFDNLFHSSLDHFLNGDDTSFDHLGDEDDFTDYTMRQGEMGNPDRAMEEDLNNGYDSVEVASGNDYFPNGADGPVVTKVGPSGAKQGDNPEQKKMQVAETHKELVYAYRKYLKESAPAVASKKKLSENQQVVSNVEAQDWSGDFAADDETVSYRGPVSFSATVLGRSGSPIEIGYDLEFDVSAQVDWESDESPTGWNYSTDNATYTTDHYASSGQPVFSSIQFSQKYPMIVGNDEMSFTEAQKYIDTSVFKKLLTPELYTQWFSAQFEKKLKDVNLSDFDPDR